MSPRGDRDVGGMGKRSWLKGGNPTERGGGGEENLSRGIGPHWPLCGEGIPRKKIEKQEKGERIRERGVKGTRCHTYQEGSRSNSTMLFENNESGPQSVRHC